MDRPAWVLPAGITTSTTYPTPPQSPTEQFPFEVQRTDLIESRLKNTFRLILKDGRELYLKTNPAAYMLLMRSERNSVENEIAVRHLLQNTAVPVAEIISCNIEDSVYGQPFLITDGYTGRPFVECQLSVQERETIARQVRAVKDELFKLRSSHFGTAAQIAKGQGYSKWHEAFQGIVEDLLKDGEDVLLNLPYQGIRNVLAYCDSLLDGPKESNLLIQGLWQSQNATIERIGDDWKIAGLWNLSDAVWVDPQFDMSRQDLEEGSTKQLLYTMYYAIRDIVEGIYYQYPEIDDSESRRNLAVCLKKLGERIRHEH